MIRRSDVLTYVAAFGAALVTALVATPLARRTAVRIGVMDHPGERKIQSDPVPYLGGLAIIAGFVAALGVGTVARGVEGGYTKMAVILGGAAVLAVVGLRDDIRTVPGWFKAVVEIPLAVALYAADVRANLFGIPFLDFLVTVAWVAGITNAVNFLDNMDGITAGVAAIAAGYFAVLAALSGQFLVGGLASALAGCALGFLWYNRPPARIYMGDAGSLFLGFLLAAVGLELRFDNLRRVTFFVPIAVLGVPIFDTIMISISRLRRRLSPLTPGLDHTSHRLLRLGLPRHTVVGLHHIAALACGWLGVVIAFAEPRTAYLLMGWLVALGAFLVGLLLRLPHDDIPT
jgi:UDP-GlcNAc:undecaprenyl-phosphate/decaprenyl-phosphate GlcNAc-1-phosphate transferase